MEKPTQIKIFEAVIEPHITIYTKYEKVKDIIFKKGSCCPIGHTGPPCACVYPWEDTPSMCKNSNNENNEIVNNTESWIPPPESGRVPSPIQEKIQVIGK